MPGCGAWRPVLRPMMQTTAGPASGSNSTAQAGMLMHHAVGPENPPSPAACRTIERGVIVTYSIVTNRIVKTAGSAGQDPRWSSSLLSSSVDAGMIPSCISQESSDLDGQVQGQDPNTPCGHLCAVSMIGEQAKPEVSTKV